VIGPRITQRGSAATEEDPPKDAKERQRKKHFAHETPAFAEATAGQAAKLVVSDSRIHRRETGYGGRSSATPNLKWAAMPKL